MSLERDGAGRVLGQLERDRPVRRAAAAHGHRVARYGVGRHRVLARRHQRVGRAIRVAGPAEVRRRPGHPRGERTAGVSVPPLLLMTVSDDLQRRRGVALRDRAREVLAERERDRAVRSAAPGNGRHVAGHRVGGHRVLACRAQRVGAAGRGTEGAEVRRRAGHTRGEIGRRAGATRVVDDLGDDLERGRDVVERDRARQVVGERERDRPVCRAVPADRRRVTGQQRRRDRVETLGDERVERPGGRAGLAEVRRRPREVDGEVARRQRPAVVVDDLRDHAQSRPDVVLDDRARGVLALGERDAAVRRARRR